MAMDNAKRMNQIIQERQARGMKDFNANDKKKLGNRLDARNSAQLELRAGADQHYQNLLNQGLSPGAIKGAPLNPAPPGTGDGGRVGIPRGEMGPGLPPGTGVTPGTSGPVTPTFGNPPGIVGGTPGAGDPINNPKQSTPFNYQQNGSGGMVNDLYNRATNGSTQAFNTSANRLRERLDSASMGAQDAATNRRLSTGFGNSGLQKQDQYNIQAGTQNAYAQGLNDLSNQFEQNRLTGLGIAGQAANTAAGAEQSYNQLLANLLNAREGRTNQNQLFDKQADLSKYLQTDSQNWQGEQGDISRQNQNWQQVLQQLMNIPGLFNGTAGGGNVQNVNLSPPGQNNNSNLYMGN